ncbi:MAG: hypothetical protein EGR30_07445 [Prevotella copri]|nr:hypothetical protein [Segatella copri]
MIKKLFTLFICTLSLATTFTSCGDEAIDVESVNKQTIFVFFPWTGDTRYTGLYSDLKNNVDSMCEGIVAKKGLNNSRVMVFMSQNYKKSYLIDLQYDSNKKAVIRDTLKTYDEATYTTAEGFAEILNEVKRRAEALNYSLIIGAHGCGWTYSRDWVNYPYMARPNTGFAPKGNTNHPTATDNFSGIQFGANPNKPVTRFFGSVSLEENALDVPTLAEGIKLSGTKMQYILFDACYMGNVETAYELKDVTNFLISSSSEIMGAGVPYKTVWNYLNSSAPNYSGFVNGVVNFYKNDSYPHCNMAAIDCRQMEKLASVMKEINSKYTLSSSVPLDSIQPLDGFSPNLFYDMSVYVDSLVPSGSLKDKFNSQMKLTIKAAAHTDEAYTTLMSYRGTTFKVKNYCGLSISDPSQHSVAIKGREKTGWWKATH